MTEDMADTPVIYPGCAGNSPEEIRACSKEKFIAFLQNEFNRDLAKEAGLDPGDHEIRTVVHIDEAGKCSALKVTSSNYRLEGEMKRVIAALPQMTPATEAGKAVPVTFILPLDFKVE
jgi:protein TonB